MGVLRCIVLFVVVHQDLFITLMFESDAAVGRIVNRKCSCTLAGILCTLDVVDKPARLIVRFLFGFDKLNQYTNTETAMLSFSVNQHRV